MERLLRDAPLGHAGLAELRELVARSGDEQLEAWMADPAIRRALLDLIYESVLGRLGSEPLDVDDAVIHWHVEGAPAGGCDSFQLMISGGVALPSRCLTRMPDLSIELGATELLKQVCGLAGQPEPAHEA